MTRRIKREPGALPRGHWQPAAAELAASMWSTTPSAAHVADAINAAFGVAISRKSVIAKMHRMGLSFQGPELPAQLPAGTKGQVRPDRARTVAPKVRPAPKPRAVPVLVAPLPRPAPRPSTLPESRRVAITEIGASSCRYIAGDPRVDPSCCGHAVEPGSSWCPGHARLCSTTYQPRVSAGFSTFRRAA
ncbi:GcrA family cell cycle regulator [uncultured Methylobacterium sp.]|uniref:GcrA family cell cycle regulator n=1 Tax=uncultured Methylobacterium sp. TaxID=157278 RepID=UPI0035CA428F